MELNIAYHLLPNNYTATTKTFFCSILYKSKGLNGSSRQRDCRIDLGSFDLAIFQSSHRPLNHLDDRTFLLRESSCLPGDRPARQNVARQAAPARLRGKPHRSPQPGAPGFGGTSAILMAFGYSGWRSFLMALFRFVSYPPGSIGPIDAISLA